MGLLFEKKTHLISILIGIASLVTICLNLLLIPLLGFMGTALSSLGGHLVLLHGTGVLSHRYYPIRIDRRVQAISLGAVGGFCMVSCLGEIYRNGWQIGGLALGMLSLFLGLILTLYRHRVPGVLAGLRIIHVGETGR
jgi:O-antigen/teichoic acid export membrane protein